LHQEDIPLTEYKATAKSFNPTQYDPEAWAEAAKQAGVKYLVITSKHHDGFALFNTKFSDWSVMKHSAYKKDLIKPLAEACRKRGIRFGLYYSQSLDWINGGELSKPKFVKVGWKPVNFDEYLKKISLPQTREILDQYHPDILWWDMPKNMNPKRAAPFVKLLAKHPNVLTNNRLGGGNFGDFATFEQSIPAAPKLDQMWESCMTMNHTWGYSKVDHEWKSAQTLIRNLIGTVSKGGNFLLNIGPDGKGNIPPASLERMAEMGKWLKENGKAIYGTGPTPFLFQQAWKGTTTTRKDRKDTLLYLHVYDWPKNGKLRVLGVKNSGCSATLLVKPGQKLPAEKTDNGWVINLPKKAPSKYSSTVVLRVPGKLLVEHDGFFMTADGVVLAGLDAKVNGPKPKGNAKNNYITNIKPTTELSWKIDVPEPGEYLIQGNLGSVGDRKMKLSMAGVELTVTVPNTNVAQYGGGNFPSVTLGVLKIKKPGTYSLKVKSDGSWGGGVALQSLSMQAIDLGQDTDGNIALPALSATGLKTYAGYNGSISDPEKLTWKFLITREAGDFSVAIDYCSDRAINATLKSGKETLAIKLPTTYGEHRRLKLPVGSISVSNSGANQIELLGNLKGLELYGVNLFIGTQLKEHKDAVTVFPHARAKIWDTAHSDTTRWQPSHAVDGNHKTAWALRFKTKLPQALEVDYGKVKTVNHLSLSTGNDKKWHNIGHATLSIMTEDGWKKIAEIKDAGNHFEMDFPEQKGSLFQLHIDRANVVHIYQLELSKK